MSVRVVLGIVAQEALRRQRHWRKAPSEWENKYEIRDALHALVFSINLSAQTAPPRVSEPQHIVVDSRQCFCDAQIWHAVSTLAGNNIIDPCPQNIAGRAQEGNKDGKALTALFNFPKGLAYDSKGNLFIADLNNHSIRRLSPDGIVTTFAK